VPEFALYNTLTEEFEDFEYMTQESADILNRLFREEGQPQRWISDKEEVPHA